MPSQGWSRHHRARILGISLLILSLLHAPWPQADFHNVRHQDGPGQVCEYHDHLLRWHPDAGRADDVAILHWHWFLPSSGPVEPGHSGAGPQLHAHVAGWDAPTPEVGPIVVPDQSSNPLDSLDSGPSLATGDAAFAIPGTPPCPPPNLRSAHTFGATFAPGISFSSWLQRWSC
ncbi:hypothetical protein P12x_000213 [Tundrisphaera lichenicola]|uniref:hypothetical protein n=1 Tax=Tundrisphaera lichenicola TaxID=2029860 RepID=UPI003EBC4059